MTEYQDPFEETEGTSKSFEISEPINFDLLQDEIEAALGQSIQMVLTSEDYSQPLSEDNPGVLFVSAENEFDGRTVRGAITAHDPDEAKPEVPVATLQERLQAGEILSLTDLNRVVCELLSQP